MFTLPLTFLLCFAFFRVESQSYTYVDCNNYHECSESTVAGAYAYECHGYESCISTNFSIDGYLVCRGGLSCFGAKLVSSLVTEKYSDQGWGSECTGYGSCAMASQYESGNDLLCYSPFSCLNINTKNCSLLYPGSTMIRMNGAQSFINSLFKSNNSYSGSVESNTRNVKIEIYGSFASYSSILYSNGNNLDIFIGGYYSGYGLIINCDGNSANGNRGDDCYIFCYGNGCVNITLNCCDNCQCSTSCSAESNDCVISQSEGSGTSDESEYKYDAMVDVINGFIHKHDEDYSLLMQNLVLANNAENRNYVYNRIGKFNQTFCDSLYITDTSSDNSRRKLGLNGTTSNKNGNLCCLGINACWHNEFYIESGSTMSENHFGNLYCLGMWSCYYLTINNSSKNVYSMAEYAAIYSDIQFIGMALCSARKSCSNSTMKNGDLIVCDGAESCTNSNIINVTRIVALGWLSLANAMVDAAVDSNIYLLSYNAGKGLIIKDTFSNSNHNSSNITVYCQNGGCDNILTQLFCGDENDIGVKICGLYNATGLRLITNPPTKIPSPAPTIEPTVSDVVSSTKSTQTTGTEIGEGGARRDTEKDSLAKLIEFLNSATLVFAIGLGVCGCTLIFVSVFAHKNNKKQNKNEDNWGNEKATHLISTGSSKSKSKSSTNGDYDVSNYSYYEKIQADEQKDEEMQRKLGGKSYASTKSSVVDYVRGYGKNSNHFVIFFVLFEIFDLYTDVAYLFELVYDEYTLLSQLFAISLIVTIIFNIGVVIVFLRNEFSSNALFTNWFYEHNGIIAGLIVLFTLTDINMIATVFTSQIFGHSIFYSPISLNNVNSIQVSNMIVLLIQHLPQMIIQIIVIFEKLKKYNPVVIATLIVTGLDIMYIAIKAIMWIVLARTQSVIAKRTTIATM